ncbi:hypothetical protein B7463_g11569, partial [Scytalidium lignicola]
MSSDSPTDKVHCILLAGPFRNITNDDVAAILFFSFAASSIILSALQRRLVLGYFFYSNSSSSQTSPSTTLYLDYDAEASADPPPPYSEAESSVSASASLSTTTPSTDIPKVDISQPRTATSFVGGTLLFALNILVLVLLAFCVQCMVFCVIPPSNSKPGTSHYYALSISLWLIYSFIALYATFGATAWATLLRDYLSGPGVVYSWPIKHEFGLIAVLFIIMFPFIFVWVLVIESVMGLVRYFRGSLKQAKVKEEDEAENLIEMGGIASTSIPEENDIAGSKQAIKAVINLGHDRRSSSGVHCPVITFTTEPETDERYHTKFHQLTQEYGFPFLVAIPRPLSEQDTDSDIIGITYVSPWRPQKLAYQHTGEMTILVHPEHKYKGIGSVLLHGLFEAIEQTKLREIIAVMAVDDEGRDGGLGLRDFYVRFGFREMGRMEKVGFKFNRWLDVVMLQMHVNEGQALQ